MRQDTISKTSLLSWLELSDNDILIEDLAEFIEAKTGGSYSLEKKKS